MKNVATRVVWLSLSIFALSPLSLAWGCSGHEIVALIAQRQLNDVAAQKVASLLKNPALYVNNKPARFCNPKTFTTTNPSELGLMAFYSTWADDYRQIEKSTAPWHFWDVPLNFTGDANLPQFCDQGCVVKAVQDQIAVLKSTATKKAKAKALALLIHFVGDLHQPLHIETNNDRGGNCVPVKFFGDKPSVSSGGKSVKPNLHGIWDSDIPEKIGHIRSATHDDDLRTYVDTLMSDFENDFPTWMSEGVDLPAWAMQGHQLAVTNSYGNLPKAIAAETPVEVNDCSDADNILQRMLSLHESVSQSYVNKAKPVVEEQLARGGTRLALILNQIWPE